MAEVTVAGRSDAACFVAAVAALVDSRLGIGKAAVAAMAALAGAVADAHVVAGFAVSIQALVVGVVEFNNRLALAGHVNGRRTGFGKDQYTRSEQQGEAEEQWQYILHFDPLE
jgi:uncharacterized protein YgfB (UPF0149 family)